MLERKELIKFLEAIIRRDSISLLADHTVAVCPDNTDPRFKVSPWFSLYFLSIFSILIIYILGYNIKFVFMNKAVVHMYSQYQLPQANRTHLSSHTYRSKMPTNISIISHILYYYIFRCTFLYFIQSVIVFCCIQITTHDTTFQKCCG